MARPLPLILVWNMLRMAKCCFMSVARTRSITSLRSSSCSAAKRQRRSRSARRHGRCTRTLHSRPNNKTSAAARAAHRKAATAPGEHSRACAALR